jgi:aspartyl-tRNA(Asn)/glutamyl-tRNA(Gln) amidotransferase subunit C
MVRSLKVSKKDMENVAVLSRLSIPEAEAAQYTSQLDAFLAYVENLKSVPTDSVKPTTYALPVQNVFREDVVKPSLEREAALANAPLREDGYFKVPRILEE